MLLFLLITPPALGEDTPTGTSLGQEVGGGAEVPWELTTTLRARRPLKPRRGRAKAMRRIELDVLRGELSEETAGTAELRAPIAETLSSIA